MALDLLILIQAHYYEDEAAPTGTCAVCVVGGERSAIYDNTSFQLLCFLLLCGFRIIYSKSFFDDLYLSCLVVYTFID